MADALLQNTRIFVIYNGQVTMRIARDRIEEKHRTIAH